jgi:alanyl-tRNA synthetase
MAAAAVASELKWPTSRVRAQFIDFFKQRQHSFVASASVVPLQDPTLLFVNSGMAQFKPLFLGTADPATDFGKLKRVANSQICIRAGGKHNDLDDVGYDTYHHTLFEMLGNWSFGDYYKVDAITWAWELLTKVYGVPEERLYVTYFEGGHGIPADEETRELWSKFVPAARIVKGNAKDNFWEMGDTGPCGPCTEIHYDYIGNRDAAPLVNKDDATVVEIWNLVFMQFNRTTKGGALLPLPAKHVDTGMGLERIVSVLQNVRSNYDIDVWLPIFRRIQEVCKVAHSYAELVAQPGSADKNSAVGLQVIAYRVIADHARTLTCALADGAAPDNQGRGFVLRRIIRRAIRYGVQFLGGEFGFFSQLVGSVGDALGDHFTHLTNEQTKRRVVALIAEEEASFARTWKTGLRHFEKAVENSRKANSSEVDAEDIFVLHDRYGFPFDLTKLLAQREGLAADDEKFKAVMKRNQTGGGRAEAMKNFFDTYQVDELNRRAVPKTDDAPKYAWDSATARVVAIFDKATGAFVDAAPASGAEREPELVGVVLDRTNFYSESGGQIFDQGSMERAAAAGATDAASGNFEVKRCFAFGGYVVHIGDLSRGALRVGDNVALHVDYERRKAIASNHTATHVLNHALREVLQYGHADQFTEVHQRGSLVTDDYLRFDFSWNNKLTPEDVAAAEKLVNDAVERRLPVYSAPVELAKAQAIKYMRSEFNTKYGDVVNVVCVGKSIDAILADPTSEDNRNYSIELCGGTHLTNFADVRRAVFISEDSLTKGVRRATLFTGDAAIAAVRQADALRAEFAALRAAAVVDFDDKVKQFSVLNKKVGDSEIPLLDKLRLRDELDKATRDVLADKKTAAAKLKAEAQRVGAEFATRVPAAATTAVLPLKGFSDREAIQAAVEAVAAARADVSIFAVGFDDAKALAVATVLDAHVARGLNAVEWIKAACGGKGGGKPTAAQGGLGADAVDAATKAAAQFATSKGL